MHPFFQFVPGLSDGALLAIHLAIRAIPPNERTEPDWSDMKKVVEETLRERSIEFDAVAS
jgi:hypothetical protein